MSSTPETVICLYRVRAGEEDAFMALLERHWTRDGRPNMEFPHVQPPRVLGTA